MNISDATDEEEYCYFETKVPVCTTHKVSIIIPTFNASQHIATTIESILQQKNVRFEIIVIDAESKDRTVDIIRSYEDPRLRIQSVPSSRFFEMINRGIAMAQGEYINIILPGDTYLYPEALSLVLWHIADNNFPELFYSACVMRNTEGEPHFMFQPLRDDFLRKGMQPTNFRAAWIKKAAFKGLGYFDTHLDIKGFLDFIIRFSKHPEYLFASEMRVFVEPHRGAVSFAYLLKSFRETLQLIAKHYGFFWACMWLFTQKDGRRLVQRFFHKVKSAFQA